MAAFGRTGLSLGWSQAGPWQWALLAIGEAAVPSAVVRLMQLAERAAV